MAEAKSEILIPNITETPGSNCGAQFSFMELLLENAEIEVIISHTYIYCSSIYLQISKDPEYFDENMEIHVKISMDGAQYTRKSSFTLLTVSIFNRDYTLSQSSKLHRTM